MKQILTILFLAITSASFGQIAVYPFMLTKDPVQSADTSNVAIYYGAGNGALTGRAHVVSFEHFAALIESYISAGLSDGDKGDITVSGSGATWNIDANAVGANEIAANAVGDSELSPTTLSGFGITDAAAIGLSNLTSVAVNTDILPASTGTIALGENAKLWAAIYLANGGLNIRSNGSKNLIINSNETLSSANKTLNIITGGADRTIDFVGGDLSILSASSIDGTFSGSSSGNNTGDQDLSGYALDANVVHLTGDEAIAGEKTFNDSLRVDDYALFKGLDGGLPTKIEMLKNGILQFDKEDAVSGSTKEYMTVRPLQQDEDNVDYVYSIFTADHYGDRFNDIHSQGWNLLGGSVKESGKQGFGHVTEGFFQEDATTLRFEDHTIFYTDAGYPYRNESLVITDGDFSEWYKYFTTNDVFGLDPRNNYKYFQFACTSDTGVVEMFLWSPKSANTKAAVFQWNETTNRLSLYPQGTSNSTIDMSPYPFSRHALIQRTAVASTYGLFMSTIAGNTSDGYFGNIYPRYGLTLTSDTLRADTTVLATLNDVALKANDADVVHDTGDETIGGVKTFSSDPLIPDEAYDATAWNGSLEVPTKNAVRDKIETLSSGGITFQQVLAISTLRL